MSEIYANNKILIFPWAKRTPNNYKSPKDYPHWSLLTHKLIELKPDIKIMQLSCKDEPVIDGNIERNDDLKLSTIKRLLQECKTWISIDSFAPHLAWSIGKRGVVIFGYSDPLIFGHPENINLLKDRKYLRNRQFGTWNEVQPCLDIWIQPEEVINAVLSLL